MSTVTTAGPSQSQELLVSHMVQGAIPCCYPSHISRELDWKAAVLTIISLTLQRTGLEMEPPGLELAPLRDASVSGFGRSLSSGVTGTLLVFARTSAEPTVLGEGGGSLQAGAGYPCPVEKNLHLGKCWADFLTAT